MAPGSVSVNSSSHSGGTVDEEPGVKILCSYGGKIRLTPYEGKLIYEGGITKIVEMDRFISYPDMISRLSDLFSHAFPVDVVLKYQLPFETRDVFLITVVNEVDLEYMMRECDNLRHRSPSEAAGLTPRLRLFIDPPAVRFYDDLTLFPDPLHQLAAAVGKIMQGSRSDEPTSSDGGLGAIFATKTAATPASTSSPVEEAKKADAPESS